MKVNWALKVSLYWECIVMRLNLNGFSEHVISRKPFGLLTPQNLKDLQKIYRKVFFSKSVECICLLFLKG